MYGGTKTEMERLIKEASKLDKSVKANDMSFGNMVKAIHAVQNEMGITGTTAKEASTTITGSLNQLKASWQNMLVSIVKGGDDFDETLDALVDSAKTFGKNLVPKIISGLKGVARLIDELAPVIAKELPVLAEQIIPPLTRAAVEIVKGLAKAMPVIIKAFMNTIVDIFGEQFPILKKIGKFFNKNGKTIATSILGIAAAWKVLGKLKSASSFLSSLKGGKGGKDSGGFVGFIESLGKTKIKTVGKAMLNLGIIVSAVTGMTVLLIEVAKFVGKFDIKLVLEFVALVTAVGVAGGAVAKVAGIVGKIPVSTVVTGMANLAIAIGATGLVVSAFGLLAKIRGINDFIDKGGDLLANLFAQIGKIVGAILGGVVEGVTSRLPKAAEYLSEFSENLQPMFDNFKGADVKGAGQFLVSFAKFLLMLTAQELLSFFTGGLDLSKIGESLGGFADKSKDFFDKIKDIPKQSFENATKMFEALSKIGGLPKSGGVVQWFCGEVDYKKISEGLGKLSNNNVKKFFDFVAKLDKDSFDGGAKLFDTLSKIGSLPKSDGVTQWFCGEVNYKKISEGLGKLSNEKVEKFFNFVAKLKKDSFEGGAKVFDTLSKIGGLPKSGGVKQWLCGDINYTKISEGLGKLASENAKKFFKFAGELPVNTIGNASKVFDALSKIGGLPNSGGIVEWFTGSIDYKKIANGLGHLANENAKKFFNMVGDLPDSAVNGTATLFSGLAKIDELPYTGGVAQWFTGTVDYAKVSQGLADFASNDTTKFFDFIKGVSDTALTNTGKFFKALQNVGDLPKSGGIFQLFTGEIDMKKIAQGLADFACENTKKFFKFIVDVDEKVFQKTERFFGALSTIGKLPASDGVVQWWSGDIDYGDIASGLSKLAGDDVKKFFTFIEGKDKESFTKMETFFTALSNIGSLPNVDGVVQWWSGYVSYKSVSDGLGKLASDDVKKFLTMIDTYDYWTFDSMEEFFTALNNIGKLPKSDGVTQWWNGEVDFGKIASGLKKLNEASGLLKTLDGVGKTTPEKLENFLVSVSYVAFIGLASLGENLEAKCAQIATAFTILNEASDFYKTINSIGPTTPQKMIDLFSAFTKLADLSDVTFTKEQGEAIASGLKALLTGVYAALWTFGGVDVEKFKTFISTVKQIDEITDIDFSGLPQMGTDLSSFITNSNGFFTGISTLPETLTEDIKGLTDAISALEEGLSGISTEDMTAPFDAIVTASDDCLTEMGTFVEEMVTLMGDLPQDMADALVDPEKVVSGALTDIWKGVVTDVAVPVNKLITGANWVLKEFGSETVIGEWKPYAKGTDGHMGGNALVNDGRGAEMVQMPNGKTFIPKGRNVFIPNAPKGMKVMTAEETARFMGRNTPTFNYAKGTGDFDLFNYIDKPKDLVGKVHDKYVSYKDMSGMTLNIGKSMVSTLKGAMIPWVKKLIDEFGIVNYDPSAGVEQWRKLVIKALKMEGQYSEANVARTLMQMQTESGGNPKAINLWDINAKNGVPSKGLMQVIDPTFRAYARPGFDKNIYDPLSNILASIRYAVSRYGSLARAYRGVGYENGGLVTKTGMIAENPMHPEWVIPTDPSKRQRAWSLLKKAGESIGYSPESDAAYRSESKTEYNTYSPQFNLTISGTNDDRTMERKVKAWIQEAMDDFFEGMASRNPRVREV